VARGLDGSNPVRSSGEAGETQTFNAIADPLEDKGIPASQLMPQGFGKSHFVATNSTAEGLR